MTDRSPGFDGATGWLDPPPLTAAGRDVDGRPGPDHRRGARRRIAYRFRDLHLVLGSGRFRVPVDGTPAPGGDVAADGTGTAAGQRLCQLVRQEPVRERTAGITVLDAGVEAFVFTVG